MCQPPIIEYPCPPPLSDSLEELAAEEREALRQVNQKVAAASSLSQMVDFLFESTRSVFPCDRIALAFVEENGARARADHAVADYEPLLLKSGYVEDMAGSSLAEVIETGRPRIIGDLEAYLREHPRSRSTSLIVREGVRSSLTCPLSVDGRNVGLLFRSSRRPFAYDIHQVRLHMAVAERLGQAVEKAYRIRELEIATKGYFEMLGFVSHELKSPVASMVTDADVLAGGYLGELRTEQLRKVESIARKGKHLLGLVEEYLDLSRIEGGGVEPVRAKIGDLVREVIEPSLELFEEEVESRGMRLKRDYHGKPVAVVGDKELLRIVLTNLIGNAIKYGREHGEVIVGVGLDGADATISVWNEGPGFPESAKRKLFQRFSRVNTPELMKQKGTGVGLYTSWRIVQMHGGRIEAESKEGSWAKFTVRLPSKGES